MSKYSDLSIDEKKQINIDRKEAVTNAWKKEKNLVAHGRGTRDWSINEQEHLLRRGKVENYQGHHMKSVKTFPEQARNPKNIQFLSRKEHLEGAHNAKYKNQSNGYFNPNSGAMENFNGKELKPVPVQKLTKQYNSNEVSAQKFDFKKDKAERQQASQNNGQATSSPAAKTTSQSHSKDSGQSR
jgi:hypothetical protein